MLIVVASGCGKTSLLTTLLLEPGFFDYNNLIIFTSTPQQQEYQLLYHGFKNKLTKENIASVLLTQNEFKGVPIPILFKRYAELHQQTGDITVTLTDKINELTPPEQLNKNKKNLIIFDDCITQKNQNVLGSFFNKGRHNSCNSIYLSQSYFDLDRMIRLNSNMLVLFKLSQRNKTDVFNSAVGTIMDKNEFYTLADNVWSKKHSYIVIDRDREIVFSDIFEVPDEEDSDS